MKEMNLFGEEDCSTSYLEYESKNDTLKYSMSMKEYLKSNPKALKVQRSCNVLRYYLRYGNGYYDVLSNIINYGDNVELPEGFENSIEIWEDFMGRDTFNHDSFFMFISHCFKVYKEESKCTKFGSDYTKYLSLCTNRIRFNSYIEEYLDIKNFRSLKRSLENNPFTELALSVCISDLESRVITDLYTRDLDKISDELFITYLEEVFMSPVLKSIIFIVLDNSSENKVENKYIGFNEFSCYFYNLMFSNIELNNFLLGFFEYVSHRFKGCDLDSYALRKFVIVGYYIKNYFDRSGVPYKLDYN